MKKVVIKRTFTLTLVALLSVVSISKAQEMRRHHRGGDEDRMREHHKEMRGPKIPNLTETQEAQLKTLKLSHDKEALPLHNELNELEARFRTLTTTEEKNTEALGRVIEDIGDLKTELMKQRVSHMEEMKEILTEEQILFLNKQLTRKDARTGRRHSKRK